MLAGLGALMIPGVGPLVAAGWFIAGLAGAGVGAAAGGLVGALTHFGVTTEHAHTAAEAIQNGGTLVLVRTDDDTEGAARIEAILRRDHRAEARQFEAASPIIDTPANADIRTEGDYSDTVSHIQRERERIERE